MDFPLLWPLGWNTAESKNMHFVDEVTQSYGDFQRSLKARAGPMNSDKQVVIFLDSKTDGCWTAESSTCQSSA